MSKSYIVDSGSGSTPTGSITVSLADSLFTVHFKTGEGMINVIMAEHQLFYLGTLISSCVER